MSRPKFYCYCECDRIEFLAAIRQAINLCNTKPELRVNFVTLGATLHLTNRYLLVGERKCDRNFILTLFLACHCIMANLTEDDPLSSKEYSMYVDSEHYGVFLRLVEELLKYQPMTCIADTPEWILANDEGLNDNKVYLATLLRMATDMYNISPEEIVLGLEIFLSEDSNENVVANRIAIALEELVEKGIVVSNETIRNQISNFYISQKDLVNTLAAEVEEVIMSEQILARNPDRLSLLIGPSIGKGAFAEVFIGTNLQNSRNSYAVKKQSTQPTRAITEIAMLSNLVHPNIISLIDYEISQSSISMVLDLGSGDLDDAMISGESINVKKLMYEISSALAYLHDTAYIIHRDVKPANILSVRGVYKLSDFGISVAGVLPTSDIRSRQAKGTMYYMPPDCISDLLTGEISSYGFRVDVYALGIVACEVILESHPFIDITDSEYMVEDDFKAIIRQTLSSLKSPFAPFIKSMCNFVEISRPFARDCTRYFL